LDRQDLEAARRLAESRIDLDSLARLRQELSECPSELRLAEALLAEAQARQERLTVDPNAAAADLNKAQDAVARARSVWSPSDRYGSRCSIAH
jgi:hypothetical protein